MSGSPEEDERERLQIATAALRAIAGNTPIVLLGYSKGNSGGGSSEPELIPLSPTSDTRLDVVDLVANADPAGTCDAEVPEPLRCLLGTAHPRSHNQVLAVVLARCLYRACSSAEINLRPPS